MAALWLGDSCAISTPSSSSCGFHADHGGASPVSALLLIGIARALATERKRPDSGDVENRPVGPLIDRRSPRCPPGLWNRIITGASCPHRPSFLPRFRFVAVGLDREPEQPAASSLFAVCPLSQNLASRYDRAHVASAVWDRTLVTPGGIPLSPPLLAAVARFDL